MKRFKFPFAYQPKLSLKETIEYSAIFKQELFSYLQNKYKCIYIDPAFIVDNQKSPIAYLNGDRIISCDNKANNSIFSLNSAQDNYLMLAAKMFKNENLLCFAPFIKRDATQTNLDSVINWNINLELSRPGNLNIDYFVALIKELFQTICSTTSLTKLRKIYKVDPNKINLDNLAVADAQKIESSHPALRLEDAFKHFCSENTNVIVKHNIKKLKSGKSIAPFIPTAQDTELSCGLYVYDETNNQPIELITVCKRPDVKTSRQQLNNTNPLEITNDLYDHDIFEGERPTNISVVINYTSFLFYFLDKIHLAEVVKSVWPKEFMDFIHSEKIEIF